MSTVNSITDFAAQVNAASKSTSTSSTQATQDQFLAMLTAQLRNQDPTNPLQNSEVTSQLAQLKMVDGISQLNASLAEMSEMFAENRALQAATMVGHGVMVPGNIMNLTKGMGLGGVDLPQSVDSLQVSISDAAGNVVQSIDLGPQKSGLLTFSWDGLNANGQPMPEGTYTYQVQASAAGKPVAAELVALTSVASVSLTGQTLTLNTTDLGAIGMSQVKQIF